MRTVPPHLHALACTAFDKVVSEAFQSLLPFPLTQAAVIQTSLGIASGGMGLRCTTKHSLGAYCASVSSTHLLVTLLTPSLSMSYFSASSFEKLALLDFSEKYNIENCLSQKELSSIIDDKTKVELLALLSPRDKANYISVSKQGCGDWLLACPGGDQVMCAQIWALASARRLSLAVFDSSGKCPSCSKELDRWGDHAIRCMNKGDRMKRHNCIRDLLFNHMSIANMAPLKEPPGITKGKERPADILLPEWTLDKGLVVDVAIVDPLQPLLINKTLAGESAAETYATNIKDHKHKHTVETQGFGYAPFVVEATGSCSQQAVTIVKTIALKLSHHRESSASLETHHIFQHISCVLQKCNAAMIAARTLRNGLSTWRDLF